MIRQSTVSGTFYPSDPNELSLMIDDFLNKAKDDNIENLKGIIAPHAGYIYSGQVASVAYKQLLKLPQKNWKVFLIGPAHREYVDISIGAFESYITPLGEVIVEQNICSELIAKYNLKFKPSAHKLEHCLEVQLPFLQKTLKNFQIIPILVGDINYLDLANILSNYQKENSLFVFSSDLSHFLPDNFAREKDIKSIEIISNLDIDNIEKIDACGHLPIATAMKIAKENNYQIKLLDYKNSGDISGDKSSVVGYSAFAIYK